ncbi:MAG: hypothetical protein ACO3CD_05945 [Candidatus Nanopelagicaceae bacterium]
MTDDWIEQIIDSLETEEIEAEEKFHGYRGSIAHLKDGRTGKILDGKGLKLFLQSVDGKLFECYHDELEYIFTE